MLSSKKLKAALFWFLYFFSQALFAANPRCYLILQIIDSESYPYAGSVSINDDVQALAAHLFFPGGHTVVIEMDIQPDGHTVDLQIDTAGQTFEVAELAEQPVSPVTLAIQDGAGNPSAWFASSSPVTHQFQLPAIDLQQRIILNKRVDNRVGEINLRFNKYKQPKIQNIGYTLGRIMLNPGTGTSGRIRQEWSRMTDAGLLQLMELLVVALMSPQLVAGSHFSTALKRDKTDASQNIVPRIDLTERTTHAKKVAPPKTQSSEDQGYFLWVMEALGWECQYIAGPVPKGFSSAGGYGVMMTSGGQERSCYIQPFVNQADSYVDPTVEHLLHQFSGMNIGVPPQNCRDGGKDWHHQGGFGGGPGSGWGGGSGGFTAQ